MLVSALLEQRAHMEFGVTFRFNKLHFVGKAPLQALQRKCLILPRICSFHKPIQKDLAAS